jgi:hypothetical protein
MDEATRMGDGSAMLGNSVAAIRSAAAAGEFDGALIALTETVAFHAWQTHVLAGELSPAAAEQVRAKLLDGTHSQAKEFRLTQLALYHEPAQSPAVVSIVQAARAAGASWVEIGAVCGITDSAAGRKWRHA